MRIPVLKAFVTKLRGPNAGSTKYLNLSSRSIERSGRLDRVDRNGTTGWGVGEGEGASGRSGSPGADEETYAEAVWPCACKTDPSERTNNGTNSIAPKKGNNVF